MPPPSGLRATPPLAVDQAASNEDLTDDIVVVSSDGHGFDFRRAYLETASAKLDRDLRSGAVGRQRTANSGRVLVPVDLSTPHLRRFLRFAHPRLANRILTDLPSLLKYVPSIYRLAPCPASRWA